ncbi:MAG: FtsX-like permease family protein [Steroidobacteraceae bacterium]
MKLHPLDRKLQRDLWRLRGQVLAIGLVIASGVGLLVMSLTSLEALRDTSAAYYERYRFADVFAQVKRAPESLAARIAAIDGVQTVETRVVRSAVLDVEGFAEPVMGQLVSVPEGGEPSLNRLALREGRYPQSGKPDEVVLSEPFALAHGLGPGDHLRAVMNGRWRNLVVVGVALSPEYVYTMGPGALMPDDLRYGVLWMGRETLQAAYDLDGAFNEVSASLLRGANPERVVDEMDRLLDRYGSRGAYPRADQASHWFLTNEIDQLETMARFLPSVFLAVAAFLTNMVVARLVAVERPEIGLLKAFGYGNTAIAWHYVKLVLAIGAVGTLLGWFFGYWLGLYSTTMYADFYRFPFLLFRPNAGPFLLAAGASVGAALLGAIGAVRRAAALSPAAAMQPPAPPLFRRNRLFLPRFFERLDQPTRIVLRQTSRWPLRSLVTSFGIAMSVAVLIVSMQWLDAIHRIVDVYFLQAQGQDLTVGLVEARSSAAVRELARMPGVLAVEPMRTVAAKLRSGPRVVRDAVQGVPAHQSLYRVYDAQGTALDLPPEGLVISTVLAERLAVRPGDTITVEVLEGRRPVLEIPVAATFETYIGRPAYIDIDALNRAMHEPPSVTAVHLRVDPLLATRLYRELKQMPQVSAVNLRSAAVTTFNETLAKTILIYVGFFIVFSATLACGVTYNAARIALAERARELATMRVLGFSRREVEYILIGEIGLLTFVALPLGAGVGWLLARWLVRAFETDLYRVPFVVEPSTFGWAIVGGFLATLASVLLVRRRLDRLDLIAVLKTRE